MKRFLYDYPFLFVFLSILTFVFYKAHNNIFWLFLTVSAISLFRFRVFAVSCVFVALFYLSGSIGTHTLTNTQGLIKGRVYDIRKNKRLAFYVKTKNAKIYLIVPKIYDNIEPYDSIVFKAKLISNIKNRGFANYLHSKGIGYIGYAGYIKKLKTNNDIFSTIQKIRKNIENEFYYFLKNREYIFLQNAIFGDSTNKSALRAMFVDTQTAHIMSVSGLHMGFVFGLFYALFYFLFANLAFVCNRFSLKSAASLFAFLPTLLYFAISGFHIPAIRSFLMVAIFIAALIYGYSKNSYNILFFAACIIPLIFGYKTVLNPSFVMSFFMSFVAIYLYGFVESSINSKIYSYMVFSFMIGLFAMPISAMYFHKAAYLSFLSNFIVVPYFGFIVMPISFMAVFASFLQLFFLKYAAFYILNITTYVLLWIVGRFALIEPLNVTLSVYITIAVYTVMFFICEYLKVYLSHRKTTALSR